MPKIKTPEDVFRLHPKIRWVGLATNEGQVIFSQMRKGVETMTPEEDDRRLLEMGALVLRGVAERSSPYAGHVRSIAILYAKFGELIVKHNENNLILTFDLGDGGQQTLLEIINGLEQQPAG